MKQSQKNSHFRVSYGIYPVVPLVKAPNRKIFSKNRPRMNQRIQWVCVDGRPIRVKKKICDNKNIRICVDLA